MTARLDDDAPPFVPHPQVTPAERTARGKQARAAVARSSHAGFAPGADRADPIALLQAQDASRVAELVPIRYGRMLATPFTFFRGAAAIMAADLATTPRSGFTVQLCGDAHLSNFGVFASAERRLVFDVNDFDETLPGPWEWDVKRLAASVEVAARDRGFTAGERRRIVLAAVSEYRRAMVQFAGLDNLAVWYAHVDVDEALPKLRGSVPVEELRRTEKMLTKARTRDHLQAFGKLIRIVDGQPRFISDPPLLVPIEEVLPALQADQFEQRVQDALTGYHRSLTADRRHLLAGFRFVHLARKVVGVGSVGTRAWVALLIGRDIDDPLLLQLKQAQPSVLEPYAGASRYANAGQRVVTGQRLMQASSDIFLGWQQITGIDGQTRDFYVRQLRDWKGSIDIEQMGASGLGVYAALCGWTLARAHARSGDRIAIAAYLGTGDLFDRAIADFAASYADQNERDHAALVAAVASGRVTAELHT